MDRAENRLMLFRMRLQLYTRHSFLGRKSGELTVEKVREDKV